MAKASEHVIQALRNTARKLESTNQYQWGHMGLCNCGFLAQEVTKLRKDQIHSRAMERHGDWNDQLNDYCPTSGLLMDDLISTLISFGFDVDDLKHLERLSSQVVLRRLPIASRNLRKNNKQDVITYLSAWAKSLEDQLITSIDLKELTHSPSVALTEA